MTLDGETIRALDFPSVWSMTIDAFVYTSGDRQQGRKKPKPRPSRATSRRTSLTVAQRVAVTKRAARGQTATSIARSVGVHRNVVRNYIAAREKKA